MPEIREITLTSDVVPHISSATITLARGQYPSYYVKGQVGGVADLAEQGSAVGMEETISVHAAAAASIQQDILTGGAEDNFSLTIGDSAGGTATFTGIIASADVAAGKMSNGIEISVKGSDSVLDYFDASPYKVENREVHRDTQDSPKNIKDIVQKVIKDLAASVDEENQELHEANQPAWSRFLEIINNSDFGDDITGSVLSYPGWRSMYSFMIQTIYSVGSSGLFAALNAIAESFACEYVPAPSGAGRLVSFTKLIKEGENTDYPGASQISSSFSRSMRTPVQRVSIEGAVLNTHRSTVNNRAPEAVVASYTEDGGIHGISMPVPAWHSREIVLPHIGIGGAGNDTAEVKQQETNEKDKAETTKSAAFRILTALAKSHFNRLQLASFTITLQECPLSVGTLPGRSMEVPFFGKGAVQMVQHTVTLEQDSAMVSTSVVLTHVKFGS